MTSTPRAHRATWFAPDRPVSGGTVHVRPTVSMAAVAAWLAIRLERGRR